MKKLLRFSSVLAILAGCVLVAGGIWGICFTYTNVSREAILTPADASIPNEPVRGPFTLKAEADSIRAHMLAMTGGKTYAEMPRMIEKLDASGNQIMVENAARATWVTATTLTTALHLGIVTYLFSGLVVLIGLISVWTGFVFRALARKFE